MFATKLQGASLFLLICRDLQDSVWYRKRGPERATHECVGVILPVLPTRQTRPADLLQSSEVTGPMYPDGTRVTRGRLAAAPSPKSQLGCAARRGRSQRLPGFLANPP